VEGLLDDASVSLIRRALSEDPAARPTAKEIYMALLARVAAQTKFPTIHDFRAISTTVPRGGDIVLTWQVENVDRALIRGPNGFSQTVAPIWGLYSLPANNSGVYNLEVWLKSASASQSSGLIQVFDLPSVDILNGSSLKQLFPPIPALPHVTVPRLPESLPKQPVVAIGPGFVPAVPLHSVEPILDQLKPAAVMVSLTDAVSRTVGTLPPPPAAAPRLDQITGLLDASVQAMGQALDAAQTKLREELQQATDGSLGDAAHRSAAALKAQADAVQP
jgi:hypothetical protein